MDTSTVLINRHHDYKIFVDLGLYCLCGMKLNKTQRQYVVYKWAGSCTSSVKRLLCLYFVGAPQEGWQFSLMFRHWLPSVTYCHTPLFSHHLKDPDVWVSLNISVQLATVLKLSETKVLYLVKFSRWQPHQMVELRVPWRWGERESSRNIGLPFNHLTWLLTWECFIESSPWQL
jgi:hypothetical protein